MPHAAAVPLNHPLGVALALGCALAWGASVVLFKRAGDVATPAATNLLKNALASVLLLSTLVGLTVTGRADALLDAERSAEDWLRLLVSGAIGITVADTLYLGALRGMGASLMAVMECAYAPLVVLMSVLLLGEPTPPGFLLAALLVVAGLLLATWPTRGEARADAARTQPRALAEAALAMVLMAVGIVLAKPALDRSGVVEASAVRLVAAVAVQLLWLAPTRRGRRVIRSLGSQAVWRALWPPSVMAGYVAMLLWIGGSKFTWVSVASVLNQLATAVTLLLSWLWLREHVPARRWWGAALSVAGAALLSS